jgi:hypothetical protein
MSRSAISVLRDAIDRLPPGRGVERPGTVVDLFLDESPSTTSPSLVSARNLTPARHGGVTAVSPARSKNGPGSAQLHLA